MSNNTVVAPLPTGTDAALLLAGGRGVGESVVVVVMRERLGAGSSYSGATTLRRL